jgi:hypothetical protein
VRRLGRAGAKTILCKQPAVSAQAGETSYLLDSAYLVPVSPGGAQVLLVTGAPVHGQQVRTRSLRGCEAQVCEACAVSDQWDGLSAGSVCGVASGSGSG